MKNFLISIIIVLSNCINVDAQSPAGTVVNDFSLTDINGQNHTLFQYLDAGKTVFINLEATWNGPGWNYKNTGALESFYQQHGPAGANDAMVFFIEADATTTSADLNGTGTSTQGDWITGTTYPIIDLVAANTFEITGMTIDYFPEMYVICPNHVVYKSGVSGTIGTIDQLNSYIGKCPTLPIDPELIEYVGQSHSCNGQFNLAVNIQNRGLNPLTQCNFQVTGLNQVLNYSWSGNLGSLQSTDINIGTGISSSSTSAQISITSIDPNPNIISGNLNVISSTNPIAIPSITNFSNTNFPYFNWRNENPDRKIGWEYLNTSTGQGGVLHIVTYNYEDIGQLDNVTTAPYNLTNVTNPILNFKVANRRYDATYFDKLIVEVSGSCDGPWTQVYSKEGSTLATGPDILNYWTPAASSDWRLECVDISAFANSQTLFVKFICENHYGNGIFIDDISMSSGTCTTQILGCTNPLAYNYNSTATIDNGSCILPVPNTNNNLPQLTPSANYNVTPSITYGTNATVLLYSALGQAVPEDLKLDLYTPNTNSNDKPLIILLHDGFFLPHPQNMQTGGMRNDSSVVEIASRFAKRGYAVASCDYRLGWNPIANTQEERVHTLINAIYRGVQDCRTAVRFFKKSYSELGNPYGIDTSHIAVIGIGHGGTIALANATLDVYEDVVLPKFTRVVQTPNGPIPLPMVLESVNGNIDGTSWGTTTGFVAPGSEDTLCYPNHIGYSSAINATVNLSGSLPDISWLDNADGPVISFHSPTDPFLPYDNGMLIVPGFNLNIIDVYGSNSVQSTIQDLGNNNIFNIIENPNFDPYPQITAAANAHNNGKFGLFPLVRPSTQPYDSKPWDWWANTNPNNANGLATNPDMSELKAQAFIDTIEKYIAPRLLYAITNVPNSTPSSYGCTNPQACNYSSTATQDNGSCLYPGSACNDNNPVTTIDYMTNECTCVGMIGATNCSDDFYFSEIVEGWSNNHAVEIFNPTNTVKSLNGYGLVRFTNGSASYGNISYLDGYTIAPHDVFVVVLDKRDSLGTGLEAPVWDDLQSKADLFINPTYDNGVWPMYFNGNDAIALVKNNGQTLVDLFGRIGEGTGFGGWSAYGTDTTGAPLYASKDHTLIRKISVTGGITSNPSSFDVFAQYDTLPANTFGNLGCHISQCGISQPCLGSAIYGCTNPQACNYSTNANADNGTCILIGSSCNDNNSNTSNDVIGSDCICAGTTIIDPNGNNEDSYKGLFYQAVLRNNDGTVMANQNANLRFSLRNTAPSGSIEYQETQILNSNNVGLVTTQFGVGTPSIGAFNNIQWGINAKFLQVEIYNNGWQMLGTQQLSSVPFAIRAHEVDPSGYKLQAPNGNCYILQVADDGTITTVQVNCN